MVSRPLVATRNFRHGAQITQVRQNYPSRALQYRLIAMDNMPDYFSFVTQRELHNMRETFWSTRTEGSPQMWQNIRSAAEASAAGDLMLANAILEVKSRRYCASRT